MHLIFVGIMSSSAGVMGLWAIHAYMAGPK